MRASGTNFLGRYSDTRDCVAPPQALRLTLYFTFPFASLTIDGEIIHLDLFNNLNDIQTLFFFSSALDETSHPAGHPDARSWRQARQTFAPITNLLARKRDPCGAPGMGGSPSSSQPVRADWLSAGLVDQICRREVSSYLL